jgi:hypothetical protein
MLEICDTLIKLHELLAQFGVLSLSLSIAQLQDFNVVYETDEWLGLELFHFYGCCIDQLPVFV